MTNLDRMNLPHHRRYQWRFVWRKHGRCIKLFAIGIAVAVMIAIGEWAMLKYIDQLTTNSKLASSIIKANIGAPCTTITDVEEGTCNLKLKLPTYWSGERKP